MANVKAGKRGLDMGDLGISLDGTVIPSSTNVRVAFANGDYTDFGGSYTFISPTQFTGTVNSITHVVNGKVAFSVSGAASDAQTLFALIDSGDLLGAQAYVLRDNDSLTGSGRDDVLYGFAGDDKIVGGGGNDVLVGGAGRDQLSGGVGADTFAFWSVTDSGLDAATRDLVKGFSVADGDRIDLSAIDANTRTTRDDRFSLVDEFTGKAGQLTVEKLGSGWLVSGDVDGRNGADFSILVKSDVALTATDFVF